MKSKKLKRISLFIMLLILISYGCSPKIPKFEEMISIEKIIVEPYDEIWDATLQVVKSYKAKIVTEDKSAGIIVYSVVHPTTQNFPMSDDRTIPIQMKRVFITVYIQNRPGTDTTAIYCFPQRRTGKYLGKFEKEFYSRLKMNLEKITKKKQDENKGDK